MTIDEFAAIDEPGRFDLIRGELLRMAPTRGEHGEIASELARHIANHVADHGLGRVYIDETGFVLSDDPPIVLCPDIAYVSADRLPPRVERRGFIRLAPDLAVEIVSPSDRMSDVQAKVDEYISAGVRLVWVVEPRHWRVTAHRTDGPASTSVAGDELGGGDVLPGLRIRVTRMFE
jgi:Uma2 family endonuclease